MSWEEMLADVARHRAAALSSGLEGVASVARTRIEKLLDPGTFYEVGVLATPAVRGADGGIAGSRVGATICGFGKIDGRWVAIASEGPLAEPTAAVHKSERAKSGWNGFVERLAREYHLPLVLLLDGFGGSNSYTGPRGYRYLPSGMRTDVAFGLLGDSPVVVGVLGDVAGLGAMRVVASHFSVIAKDHGRVFTTTPDRAAQLAPDEAAATGSAELHTTQSGAVDNLAEDEDGVLSQIRGFLSYLPSNVFEAPPDVVTDDPSDRLCEELVSLVPENRRRPYDARKIARAIVDADSFFEIAAGYGRALVTGLARVGGQPVGVLANDPRHLAGAMDLRASEKQTRFVELCDTFHLPLVYLVDVPGFMIGVEAERSGLMRRGVRALQALHRATVPVFTIQIRRSYGLAGNATGAPNRLSVKIAWPLGEWGDMPIEGGVDALFRQELENSANPDQLRLEIESRMKEEASIWRTAEAFGLEDLIDPRETRRVLSQWMAVATQHRSFGRKPGPGYRP